MIYRAKFEATHMNDDDDDDISKSNEEPNLFQGKQYGDCDCCIAN